MSEKGKWPREEGDEQIHEKAEKTLQYRARYDPGKTAWEFIISWNERNK